MPRVISTRAHGVLDYLSVGGLWALPRALRWDATVTNLLTGAAAGTLVYSLLTRYELGAVKLLPMRAHLALDGISGLLLCGAPALLGGEPRPVSRALVGLGVFEVGASLLTKTQHEAG